MGHASRGRLLLWTPSRPAMGRVCVCILRPISRKLVLFPDFWISSIYRYFSFTRFEMWCLHTAKQVGSLRTSSFNKGKVAKFYVLCRKWCMLWTLLSMTLILKSKKDIYLSDVFALFVWHSTGYISGICSLWVITVNWFRWDLKSLS